MTIFLVWLLVFAVVLTFCQMYWERKLKSIIERFVPDLLLSKTSQDRWVYSAAIAILAATFIVKPVSTLMTFILIGVIAFVLIKVGPWVMSKVKLH